MGPEKFFASRTSRGVRIAVVDSGHRRTARSCSPRGLPAPGPHREITIFAVLWSVTLLSIRAVVGLNTYVVCTCTTLPGALFGVQVGVTVTFAAFSPGTLLLT